MSLGWDLFQSPWGNESLLASHRAFHEKAMQLALQSLTESQKTAVTGTELEENFAAQIIGKEIPIFVGGQATIGCRIAEGPFIRTVAGEGFCDMIVTAAVAATPGASRTIPYLNLNGTKSWTLADGFLGSAFSGMGINFLYGTEEQTPLTSSISRYGSNAVPYRSHICVELTNIPLAVFANLIPFVSIRVYESDYLTRNDALTKLAAYARFSSEEYEIDVSGQDPFWIVIQQSTFLQYVQELQKTVGRNWNIVPSDKLRIFENGASETPITIQRSDIVADSIRFTIADPRSIPAMRSLGFIDTGRDNDFNSVRAVRARFPIPLTASEDAEDLNIPIGMEAIDAKFVVNRSLLIDDIARHTFSCRVLPHMRGLQPGDIIEPDVDAEISFGTARIISVARNATDWTADIVAERLEMSRLAVRPSITSNGAGPTAEITVNEGVTAITTVTAADADDEDAFSIIGGADAALVTIDPDTGEVEFLSAPDFEDPEDANGDNIYEFTVQVIGSGLTDTQAIAVTVANVAELGEAGSPMGLLLSLTYP